MTKPITVYKALPEDVSKIVALLQSHNLDPVVIDDPGKFSAYRRHEVRIGVPAAERDRAVDVLREMEQRPSARVSMLSKQANRVVLTMIGVLALGAVLGLIDDSGRWLGIYSLVVFVPAAAYLIRWGFFRKSKDTSRESSD
ncbi:MAG: hypothetical protein JSU70_02075 [Phycisphaerales bacterium]|nr:MAG: hypothetical protein JSU70_02075 [Phycisphaerales bacterium]